MKLSDRAREAFDKDPQEVKGYKPEDIEVQLALSKIKTPWDIPTFFQALDFGIKSATDDSNYQTIDEIFKSKMADCVERAMVCQYIFDNILNKKYEFHNLLSLFYPPRSFAFVDFNVKNSNIMNRVTFRDPSTDSWYGLHVLALNMDKIVQMDVWRRKLGIVTKSKFIEPLNKDYDEALRVWYKLDIQWLKQRNPLIGTTDSTIVKAKEKYKKYKPIEYRIYEFDSLTMKEELNVYGFEDFEANIFNNLKPIKIFKIDPQDYEL